MSDVSKATLEQGREEHAKAAKIIFDLAASQVRNATELGRHAAQMGIGHTENPFHRMMNRELESAWASGWVVGYHGGNQQ